MNNEIREQAQKAMCEYVDYDRQVAVFRDKHFSTMINGIVVKEMELPFTNLEIQKMIEMEEKLEKLHVTYITMMRFAFQK